MFKILNKQILSKDVKRVDIHAPAIAAKIQAGQFVVVIPRAGGEWVSLSVTETELQRGLISVVFQERDAATVQLGAIPIHEEVYSVIGPLGSPVVEGSPSIDKTGFILCAAEGLGAALILPVCRAFKKSGYKVIGIMGAESKPAVTLEPQMRIACHKIHITTKDGSYERRGTVADMVRQVLGSGDVGAVYAAGPVDMMQGVCQITRERGIKTFVLFNPGRGCGMGFCGACRVRVDGKTVLSCVDGPAFDGHRVDFEYLKARQSSLPEPEREEEKDEVSRSIAKFFPGMLGK